MIVDSLWQYPILGIPTIIAGETPYSDAQFNLQPKTKKDYFKLSKVFFTWSIILLPSSTTFFS